MFWHSFHLDRAAMVANRPLTQDDPIGRSEPVVSHVARGAGP